jgi:hypothetical protein
MTGLDPVYWAPFGLLSSWSLSDKVQIGAGRTMNGFQSGSLWSCYMDRRWLLGILHPNLFFKLMYFIYLYFFFKIYFVIYLFFHLFTCAYIVWVISPPCPTLPPSPTPLLPPLSSRQVLFCPYH